MPSFNTCLCLFALLVFTGSIWTQWMATPKAKLFPFNGPYTGRWVLSVLVLSSAFLSYWLPEPIVTVVALSLLITAKNAAMISWVRGLGEEGYLKLAVENASKESFWPGLLARILPALFYGLLGIFILFFFRTTDTWGFWIASGVVCYSLFDLSSETMGYLRFRKLGKAASEAK